MEHCATCDYFQRHEPVAAENQETHQIEFTPNPQGICMVHPPVLYVIPTGSITAYPQVKDVFGCGEHVEIVDNRGQVG